MALWVDPDTAQCDETKCRSDFAKVVAGNNGNNPDETGGKRDNSEVRIGKECVARVNGRSNPSREQEDSEEQPRPVDELLVVLDSLKRCKDRGERG